MSEEISDRVLDLEERIRALESEKAALEAQVEVYIPMLPPKPSFSLKGAVKARTKITIDLPSVPPPNPDDDEANR